MSTKKTGSKASAHIRVRMYNVGFGDCFLLWIPTTEGERRVLVDCGFHSQGKGQFTDQALVRQIKEDLAGEPINVVVATHRHQDHISGFGEKELWKDIPVEEVWLPFTMRPDASRDEPALAAWESLLRGVAGLVDEGGRLTPVGLSAMGAKGADEQQAIEFMLWNARSNAPGIENLLRGMRRADGKSAKRRFLPDGAGDIPKRLETTALPGVVVHILGPSRDPEFRKKRKMPAGWGVVEDAMQPGGIRARTLPFGPEWQVPPQKVPSRPPFQDTTLRTMRGFNTDLLAAASQVDGFINGESLVLVLEVGRARLLLPGDAEVGAWMKILDTPKATALAASATFLKVGHHGSHNATPLVFLDEHLADKTLTMMSTQEGDGPFRNGIPRQELLEKLKEHHMPLARSDQPEDADAGFVADPGGRWIDCKIPC